MKIAWLIEETTFDDISKLINVLTEVETPVLLYKNIPFEYKQKRIQYTNFTQNDLYEYDKIFVYGSLSGINAISRYGLLPFPDSLRDDAPEIITWCNLDQFKCSYYFPRLQHFLLNMNGMFIPYGCFKSAYTKSLLFNRFGNNKAIFVRPDSGYKNFSGHILTEYRYDDYSFWENNIKPEELCLVSEPKNIYEEWRCVIDATKKEIVSASKYKKVGNISTEYGLPNDAVKYVYHILNRIDYFPNPFYTLDICNIDDAKDYYIVEPNSMSCSGLYDCNRLDVVTAINNYLRNNDE